MIRTTLAMATAAMFALACGLGGGGDEKLDDALIRTVERGALVDEVSESGRIAPAFEVDIKSKVSGEIAAVHVDEGQAVHKGDPLYEIVDTDYARDVELSKVQLERARLGYDNAKVERDRKEKAYAARGVSGAEVDLARRQVDLARTDVDAAKVQLETSQDRLAYTKITAPMDGVVIRRNVEPGEVVTAGMTATVNGEPQLTIARLDTLLLELDLNQVDVAKIVIDQPATLLLDAYPGKEVPGKVAQIAAAGHTDTSRGIDVFTVKVEVDPAQAGVEIKPGMTAEVRIKVGEWADVVKLPAETVFEEEGKSYVYTVKDVDGTPTKEKTAVEVGHRSDREIEVTSGVAAGDKYYAEAEVKDLGAKID
jgi:macrolide-specific efflux system membrane fusion protein